MSWRSTTGQALALVTIGVVAMALAAAAAKPIGVADGAMFVSMAATVTINRVRTDSTANGKHHLAMAFASAAPWLAIVAVTLALNVSGRATDDYITSAFSAIIAVAVFCWRLLPRRQETLPSSQ